MANSIGGLFRVTSFGESHGRCVGVVIDGCPAGLPVTEEEVQAEVDRRKPGRGVAATRRVEEDRVEVLSGVFQGRTTGAPVCLLVWNKDVDSIQYEKTRQLLRPGHADYTAFSKYGGFNDFRGGGRFSGRITAGWVMAGAIARKLLALRDITVFAHTIEIGGIKAAPVEASRIKESAESSSLRCADLTATAEMERRIEKARAEGDSLGGIVEGIARNVPVGLGEPVFDTLDGALASAMLAIPGIKGVEFGAGFAAAGKKGSENNDPFTVRGDRIETETNNAGGILGGISSGMPVVLRVAVKPTASIGRPQQTVDINTMEKDELSVRGRHDVCIVPRAAVVVEAMMAVTLCDFALRAGIIPGVIR